MISLFKDERILTESNDGLITLTTHRICKEEPKKWGRSYNQNIMLEHITSTENYSISHLWLYLLAALCVIVGFILIQNENEAGIIGIFGGIVLVLIYYSSKKNLIIIGSPSTKMYIKVERMDKNKVLDFINKIEQAKNNRIASLNKSNLIN